MNDFQPHPVAPGHSITLSDITNNARKNAGFLQTASSPRLTHLASYKPESNMTQSPNGKSPLGRALRNSHRPAAEQSENRQVGGRNTSDVTTNRGIQNPKKKGKGEGKSKPSLAALSNINTAQTHVKKPLPGRATRKSQRTAAEQIENASQLGGRNDDDTTTDEEARIPRRPGKRKSASVSSSTPPLSSSTQERLDLAEEAKVIRVRQPKLRSHLKKYIVESAGSLWE